MARLLLSDTDDWTLEVEDDQDVRGYRVVDIDGADTGRTVDDMIVDTDAELVDAVVFSDGTEYPTRELSIGDGVVYATDVRVAGARHVGDIDGYGRVRAAR